MPWLILALAAVLAHGGVTRGPGSLLIDAPETLKRYRDHARVLLVFAPEAHDARLQQQSAELMAHRDGVTERQLVVIPVVPRGALEKDQQLCASEAQALRRRFQVKDEEFLVVLVGKDGGEKLRSPAVLGYERLSAVIDSMPMRQQEMRDKAKHNPR